MPEPSDAPGSRRLPLRQRSPQREAGRRTPDGGCPALGEGRAAIGREDLLSGWAGVKQLAGTRRRPEGRAFMRGKPVAWCLGRPRAAAALAVAGALIAAGGCSPTGTAAAPASSPGVAAADCLSQAPPACYTPQVFRTAYGVQPLLDRGIDGRGQTVVLLEGAAPAGLPPTVTDIRQDLARFDRVFGLPAARLQVINSLARSPSPWLATGEEVEDTEIVHAVAPGAAIREVLVSDAVADSPASGSAGIAAALRLSAGLGAVISFSGGTGERCFTPAEAAQLNAALQAARNASVTVVSSSGDSGAASRPCPGAGAASAPVKGVNLPASDPLTLAVGGTSLQASRATGAYIGETAWYTPAAQSPRGSSAASGGGFSQVFPRPAYQEGVRGIGAARGVPDVPPTPTPAPAWPWRSATAASTTSSPGPAEPAPPPRCGPR